MIDRIARPASNPPPSIGNELMNRVLLRYLEVLTVLAFLTANLPGQEARSKEEEPLRDIRVVLAKYCVSCHGETTPKAGLNLGSLGEPTHAADFIPWAKVRQRIRSGQMPPADRPQPTAREREHVLGAVESVLARHTLDGQPDPGPWHARRMNVREYMNTLRDLVLYKGAADPRKRDPRNPPFATKPDGSVNTYRVLPPPEHLCNFVLQVLPQDTRDGGFDTVGDNLSIPSSLLEKYLRCSRLLLDDVFALKSNAYREGLFNQIERTRKGQQTVPVFLRAFATKAFRRPATAEEVARYVKLFDLAREKGDDFDTAIRLPLQAILVSPNCVLLGGEDRASKATASVRPLSDLALASRLSYFLWSSTPDEQLFRLAEQGKLQVPQVLEQQVQRMLNDYRVRDGLLKGFLCQWLQLDRLERASPDVDRFPFYFQNNLAELMTQELVLFADVILVEDRNILEFVDADWGFLCYPLAQHYDIDKFPGRKPPSNAQVTWYRVKYPDRRRGGVLTMGKVLTGTSSPLRTSPVQRGKWVLESILGTPPPPPPPDVDNVLKEEKGEGKKLLTVPQLMERHRANPACYSCHRAIDPLGIALENFDPVGRWRERDQDQPVVARGSLAGGKEFDGVVGLKDLLVSRRDDFVRSFVEQMLTYALGRKLEFYDAPAVKQIFQAVIKDEGKLSRVVVEVARSYPFRHRRTKEPTP